MDNTFRVKQRQSHTHTWWTQYRPDIDRESAATIWLNTSDLRKALAARAAIRAN